MLVAFMALLLPEGYTLNDKDPTFKQHVRVYGDQAQVNLLSFLRENGIGVCAMGTIVKVMRGLHKHDVLDDLIGNHAALARGGRVCRIPCSHFGYSGESSHQSTSPRQSNCTIDVS